MRTKIAFYCTGEQMILFSLFYNNKNVYSLGVKEWEN